MAKTIYKDYFQIDENYFPCVNESAINAGLKWDEFYPHSTFIDLLRKPNEYSPIKRNALVDFRCLWNRKPMQLLLLVAFLTVPIEEVKVYFNKYEAPLPIRQIYCSDSLLPRKKGRF